MGKSSMFNYGVILVVGEVGSGVNYRWSNNKILFGETRYLNASVLDWTDISNIRNGILKDEGNIILSNTDSVNSEIRAQLIECVSEFVNNKQGVVIITTTPDKRDSAHKFMIDIHIHSYGL